MDDANDFRDELTDPDEDEFGEDLENDEFGMPEEKDAY